ANRLLKRKVERIDQRTVGELQGIDVEHVRELRSQVAHEGRFAGARRAGEADDIALCDGEFEVFGDHMPTRFGPDAELIENGGRPQAGRVWPKIVTGRQSSRLNYGGLGMS